MAQKPKLVQVIAPTKHRGISYPAISDYQTLNVQSPPKNIIIAGLPRIESDHVQACLQPVSWHSGQILLEVAAPVGCFYFPESGMVCTFAAVDDGRTVALAAIGREGFLGVSAFLGSDIAPLRAVVVIDGSAAKLSRVQVQHLLPVCPQFAASLRRYSSSYLAQIATNGACHALHSVPQRVASWLLIACDRTSLNSLLLTHETLSELLGCRRTSITESLSSLENADVIHRGRGQISILDHRCLAEHACGCYRAGNAHAAFG